MEFGIWNLECGMWNVESGMWNLECGMWNLECGIWKHYHNSSVHVPRVTLHPLLDSPIPRLSFLIGISLIPSTIFEVGPIEKIPHF